MPSSEPPAVHLRDKEQAMQAGFDLHLTKPADMDHVLSLVADAPKATRFADAS
jgi:CheY-like chemotaxis protein